MNEEAISAKLKAAVGAQINLRTEGLDKFSVSTPFRYEDGDHLEIYLRLDDGRVKLTDEGLTLMKLSYDVPEYDSGSRNKILERILATEHVTNASGVLSVEATEDNLGAAFLSFVEAVLRVSDISFLKREIVKSLFLEEFRAFIEQNVRDRRIRFDYHYPDVDPHGTYPIDCVIENGGEPLFAFAIARDDKCRDATITILHYERLKFNFASMVVFEDQEEIGRNVLARLTDVCDRQFSSLPPNKERIAAHVIEATR